MPRRPPAQTAHDPFAVVQRVGLTLPEVEATTRYDGAPVLKLRGTFVAALATHPSAEPDTLVVRYGIEEREWLLEDAPETYYLTDYYRSYPLILVRLARVDEQAVRDLLIASCRLAGEKATRPTAKRRTQKMEGKRSAS